MSYYEDRIKALEARIEEMAMLNRMKAVPVEAKLLDRIGELNAENARLKAEVERLTADLPKMVAWGRGLEHDKRLLQEENSRLKAAGDQFAKDMVSEYGLKRCKHEDVYINWLAAKGELL